MDTPRSELSSKDSATKFSFFHGAYWLMPLLAFVCWSMTLLGLLLMWLIDDQHRMYRVGDSTVTLISYVGATHKPFFIAGTTLTFVTFSATVLMERYLRRVRRIPGNVQSSSHATKLDISSIVFAVLGGLCLMLLSIFDAFNHSTAHFTLTAVFVIFIAISTVLQTQEVRILERTHLDRAHLRRNAIMKLIIVSLAIAGAIVFAVMQTRCRRRGGPRVTLTPQCNLYKSVGASFEWFIATLFDAYILTFILDFLPARKTAGRRFDEKLVEGDLNNTLHEHKDGRAGQPFVG